MLRIGRGRIVGFHWDEGNARKNIDKQDVSRSETEEMFLSRKERDPYEHYEQET